MNSTFKCLRKESQHYSINCVSNHALLHSINDTWCTHNIVNIVWIHKFSGTGWLLSYNYLDLISSRNRMERILLRGTLRQVYFFLPHDQKYRQVHISILSSSYSNHFFCLYSSSTYSNLSLRWDKNKTEKIFFELEK